ncbi:MAG: stalk domain-containing protein [Clostridia bacterium]|nr:stalk domain-containing protein [Clostridia bacterium]
MFKKISAFLLVSVMCLGFAENSFAVRYREVTHENDIKYRDNLQNGDMSDWKVFIDANKQWSIGDLNGEKALVCTSDSTWLFSAITPDIPDKDMENCRISADFVFKERFERSGLIFRASDDRNLYEVNFGIQSGAGIVSIAKRMNCTQWEETVLYSSQPSIPLNQLVNMAVEVVDNHFSVYINNQLIFEYTDNDNPLVGGKVGLLHEYGTTRMLNVKITALETEEKKQKENKYSYKRYANYDIGEINDFSDAICDFYGWDDYASHTVYFENNNLIVLSDTDDEYYKKHTVSYSKKEFQNEPIEFEARGEGREYTLSFKNPQPNCPANFENDGYNLKVTKDNIFLEKWIAGKKTEFGSAVGNFMSDDEYKNFKIVPEVSEKTLKITVYSGDNKLIEAEDSDNVIIGGGYISILSYLDELFIKQPSYKEKTLKQLMGITNAALVGSSNIYLGGSVSKIDSNESNLILESSTLMIPLKGFATKLGANVIWNNENKTVELNYNGNNMILANGYTDYFRNGAVTNLGGMCKIKDGITYVPSALFENEFSILFYVLDNGLVIISYKGEDITSVLKDNKLLDDVYSKLK